MYQPTIWKDEVVEHPYRYRETVNSDGSIEHIPDPGETIEEGTPQSERNFKQMELGAVQGILLGGVIAQYVNQLAQKVAGLEGEIIEVTLTNTQAYPFNNSKKTVSLSKNRNTKNYTVFVEILEKTGGGVGDIEISDKLLNGFKIAHTGAASAVKVRCVIQGGI